MAVSLYRLAGVAALALTAGACAPTVIAGGPAPERSPNVVVVDHPKDDRGRGNRGHEAGRREDHRPLGIPPGHLPPPGQCRLWFPGRPPGHQPRAGTCRNVMHDAPAGAWVLYRPDRDRRVVHTRVIDTRRPGVVVSIRVYDANSGAYLHVENP